MGLDNKSTSGNEKLESVACDEGRISVTYSGSGTASYRDDWHVRDYLGNTRLVVNITSASTPASTGVLEKSDYLPFGTRVATSSTPLNRWRQSGKEEQVIGGNDLGVLDFGARHYDPWLARWTTQDPMAGKYTNLSPYSYCAGNPVFYVDTNGTILYFAKGADRSFKAKFSEVVQFMNKHNTSFNLAKLQASNEIYYIAPVSASAGKTSSHFNPKNRTIYWDPDVVVYNEESQIITSPATVLAHEAAHAIHYDTALQSGELSIFKAKTQKGSDPQFTTIEDRDVIGTIEQTAARKHGEIGSNMVTRDNHKGKTFSIRDYFPGVSNLEDLVKQIRIKNDQVSEQ